MDAKQAKLLSEENKYKQVDESLEKLFSDIEKTCKYGLTCINWYGLNFNQERRLIQLGYEIKKLDERESDEANFLISWNNL